MTAIRFVHQLAMAFFVGGQLFLVAAVMPALRADADGERLRLVARRFGWGTLVAIAVLVATGIVLASHLDRWQDGTLHLKLVLVALVGLLVVLHMRRPQVRTLDGAIFLGSLGIAWLGVSLAH